MKRRLHLAAALACIGFAAIAQPAGDYVTDERFTPVNEAVRRGVPASLLDNRWDSPLLHLVRYVPNSVFFNNGGSRFTGEYQLGASLNISGILSQSDDLTVSGLATEERFLLQRISYLTSVGDYDTRVGLRYLDFDYRVGKEFSFLRAHGQGRLVALQVLQPVMHSRDASFFVQLLHEDSKLRDNVDRFNDLTDTAIVKTSVAAIGSLRDSLFGGGLTGYSFRAYEGDVSLRPAAKLFADQAEFGRKTAGRFGMTRYSFVRLQRINDDLGLTLNVFGQTASKNLAVAEQFSLGGPNGVSAYPVGEATGDRGYVARAALQHAVPDFSVRGGNVALSVFYEQGRVQIEKDVVTTPAENRRSLAAYGFGIAAGKRADFSFILRVAWRADHERVRSDPTERRPRAWFQFAKWF